MLFISLFLVQAFCTLSVVTGIGPNLSRASAITSRKNKGFFSFLPLQALHHPPDDGPANTNYVALDDKRIAYIPRGGASVIQDDENNNLILSKLRNAIRSILEICERKAPWLATTIQSICQNIESMLGIRLLPSSSSRSSKTKRSKRHTKTDETKDTSKSKKKKKSRKSSMKDTTKKETTISSNASSKSAHHVHFKNDLKSSNPNHRIQRELKQFLAAPPHNLSVNVGSNIRVWIITMKGFENTIYEKETYKLKITFPDRYPAVPPSAYFLKPAPRHEHVYTNGDICLSLLGKDWRPTMTAQSIAVSILSILSSAKKKSLPMDNSRVAGLKPGRSQENWVYHDDNC